MEKPWLNSYAKGIPESIQYERTTMPRRLEKARATFGQCRDDLPRRRDDIQAA
jgi:hypothetical protein